MNSIALALERRAQLVNALLWLIAAVLAAIAARTMSVQFYRLTWDHGASGAIDLKIFQALVNGWLTGQPVYTPDGSFTYPPASYLLLWPLVGWLPVEAARWWWAAGYLAALTALILLIAKEIRATTVWERVLTTLTVLAANSVGVCIGNGQLIVFLLPLLLLSVFLVARGPVSWHRDLLAPALFVAVLVKPTVTAPFFWLLLFCARRLRPALLAMGGYLALTLLAVSVRDEGAVPLLRQWLHRGAAEAGAAGYGNLQLGLYALGLDAWMVPASLAVVGAAGLWLFQHRDDDIWVLLGVAGVVARVWSYHRVYDDVLILLPAIALYRIAKQAGRWTNQQVQAGAICALVIATMVAPGPWHDIAVPWRNVYDALHVLVWLLALTYLMRGRYVLPQSSVRTDSDDYRKEIGGAARI